MSSQRAESDGLLLTVPLLTDLDRRLFPVLLCLVQEVDGHRICMRNWNSSQITQLDEELLSTDSVTALSESLLALSKHLVSRIDTLWAARQQALYYTALSNTPEADPALLRTLQRRCLKRRHITASVPTVLEKQLRHRCERLAFEVCLSALAGIVADRPVPFMEKAFVVIPLTNGLAGEVKKSVTSCQRGG